MNIRVPLLVSFIASTAGLVLGSKSIHAKGGLVFTGLALIHTYKYRRNIYNDIIKGSDMAKMLNFFKIPVTQDDVLLSQVQVAHYIAGRIRLTSRRLVNNQALAAKIEASLKEIKELKGYKLNTVTGSILIEYAPEAVARNPRLAKIEQAVINKYKRM